MEESFLSQEIRDILLNSGVTSDNTEISEPGEFVNADFTLNWQKIADLCDPIEAFSYENCKKIISLHMKVWKKAPIVFSCGPTGSKLENIPLDLYLWTHRSDFIEKILSHKNLLEPSKSVENTLILSSVIEYALGNVYFLICGKNPPHLLRDLLATEELVGVFGKDRLFFLQILIGTPNGINLRNVVWHGFPANHEIPVHYPCVLLLVIFSFGRILKDVEINPRRLSYNPVEMINKDIKIDQLIDKDFEKILDHLKSSSFISSNHIVFFEEILRNFSTGNYSSGVILFLPQFELILRRIYGQVNEVDIRAKIGSFYVILDTFMEEILPDGEKINQIFRIFHPGVLHLIHDLFMAPKGPRIRDKISHGELSLQEIENKDLLEKLIFLQVGVLSQMPEHNSARDLCAPLWEYRSQFHPNGFLLINLKKIGKIKKKLKKFVKEIPEELNIEINPTDWTSLELEFHVEDLKIFFRPPEETEIVGILNNILTNAVKSSENILESLQERLNMHKSKLLRSKRRETLKKCIQLLPKINSWLLNIFQMIQDIFNLMQNSSSFWEIIRKDKLKRLLRKIQKYSENLTQSTQMSSNDWIRSADAVDKSVETLTKVMHLVDLIR